MAIRLNDAEISRLLAERKPLPLDYRERIQTKPKRGHKERELDVKGADGSEFRLILRQSEFNLLDFSLFLLIGCPSQTCFSACAGIMARVTNIRTLLRVKLFTISIYTWQPSDIRTSLVCGKTAMRSLLNVLLVIMAQFAACWETAGLTYLSTRKELSSRRIFSHGY